MPALRRRPRAARRGASRQGRLGYEKSKQVYDHLVATGMVDGKGAVTPELKAAAEEGKVLALL